MSGSQPKAPGSAGGYLLSGILTAALGNLFLYVPPPPDICANKAPLDIDISARVWALMGISLTSAVAAALVNQNNRARGRAIIKNKASEKASWADLFVATEGPEPPHVDLTRVQSFYFTAILAIAYVVLLQLLFAEAQFICKFPELSQGMLTLLGISHVGYITAKAVPK